MGGPGPLRAGRSLRQSLRSRGSSTDASDTYRKYPRILPNTIQMIKKGHSTLFPSPIFPKEQHLILTRPIA